MNEAQSEVSFATRGGVQVRRVARDAGDGVAAIAACRVALDTRLGAVFSSDYEYPGRYTRWDVGFVDPPLSLTARGREVVIAALNARGVALLPGIREALAGADWLLDLGAKAAELVLEVREPQAHFTEEERIKQPTAFSAVRAMVALFSNAECPHLGLYGAFGYDLTFQFDAIVKRIQREPPAARSRALSARRDHSRRSLCREGHALFLRIRARRPHDRGSRARWRGRAFPLCQCRASALRP